MVAPITLNVRHIKGHTFTVEVDHDADTLGLKVVIWEAEHIPVDQQRLVFGGKELTEGVKLSTMGITDGAQLFLIESGDQVINNIDNNNNNEVASAAVVPPAFAVGQQQDVQEQSGSFMVSMPQPDSRSSRYELVSDEQTSNERVSAAIALSKYVRIWCIFGFILSLLSATDCGWSLVLTLFYVLGWIGCCKLNRCLLVFPLLIAFFVGFIGTGTLIYHGIAGIHLHGIWIAAYIIMLFIGVFHIMIFMSILKLMGRIRILTCDEWMNARAKIRTRSCCC